MHFSKTRTFAKFTRFSQLHPLFCRIPCLFQNFRVFKKFPVQSSSRIPQKNSVFFQKFPVQKTIDFTNSVFFSKNSVFYKIPRFSDFKKTLEKTMYFCIKTHIYSLKVYIYRLKTFTKDKGSVYV